MSTRFTRCTTINTRFVATDEEKDYAEHMRLNALNEINHSIFDPDMRSLILWMVNRCPEETLQRKARRKTVDAWFTETLSLLNIGDCFTMRGLFNTYNAPQKVRNYGVIVLSELVEAGVLEVVDQENMTGLIQTSSSCNIYRLVKEI